MNNFNWTQFTKQIFINAEIKSVYNSWTKSELLEKWFLSKAIFYAKSGKVILPSENAVSDCIYKWNWFAQNHFEEGNVINANGIDRIEFTFAGNCKVLVELSKVKNQTLVELTKIDIPIDDNSK